MVRQSTGTRGGRKGILRILAGFLSFVAVLLLFGLVAVFASTLAIYQRYASQFRPPDQYTFDRPSEGAKILDRNGKLLYQYVSNAYGVRDPVKLDDISPAMLAVTIAAEDPSFFSNPGINIRGLARAAWDNFSPLLDGSGILKSSGGSSITQQLVKNVYIAPDERGKRSLDRKIREIVYSIELTKRYSKAQILDWYLNQISYGGVYNGVEAASEGYFGKPAKDLTLAEAATLAGIPQSPASYDPRTNPAGALQRRNEILNLLQQHQPVQIGDNAYFSATPAEIEAARTEQVQTKPPTFTIEAPHFVLTYLQPQLETLFGHDALMKDGLTVTTTLDLDLQKEASNIINHYVSLYEKPTGTRNGAMVVMSSQTGEILAMVGSLDYFRPDIQGQVNAALAPFTPGSSFKPFMYLDTFVKLGWTPSTVIQDVPTSYRETDGTIFTPQNPVKNSYQGNLTVRSALGNSLNVPAFRTALTVGVPNIVSMAKTFGFTGINGYYGPSIAIGGWDLKLIDLVYAYSVLANNGVMKGQALIAPRDPGERQLDPISILKVTDVRGKTLYDVEDHRSQQQIVGPEYAYMITSILTDPSATCITFGCGGLRVPGYNVAVKTGTGQPYEQTGAFKDLIGDTLAFGYTPDYTVGVWAGNDDNTPVHSIFSTTIAFPAMRDGILTAYAGRPETPFQQPNTLTIRNGDLAPLRPGDRPIPVRSGPEPPRCAQLRGRPYASDADRQFFLQNCLGFELSPVPPSPPPVTSGPDRMSCPEIAGTAYRSDAERAWFLQNCSLR